MSTRSPHRHVARWRNAEPRLKGVTRECVLAWLRGGASDTTKAFVLDLLLGSTSIGSSENEAKFSATRDLIAEIVADISDYPPQHIARAEGWDQEEITSKHEED